MTCDAPLAKLNTVDGATEATVIPALPVPERVKLPTAGAGIPVRETPLLLVKVTLKVLLLVMATSLMGMCAKEGAPTVKRSAKVFTSAVLVQDNTNLVQVALKTPPAAGVPLRVYVTVVL